MEICMQVAFMFDGSFFHKKMQIAKRPSGEPVTADDVLAVCEESFKNNELRNDQLFRIYYYDCYPFSEVATNPISGQQIHFGQTDVFRARKRFVDDLKYRPRLAFRSGRLSNDGWQIPPNKTRGIIRKIQSGQSLEARDVQINLNQKEVDIKIGLDIAWLASKRIVDKIVLVTGDSDFVPAMKFARREGLMVYLVHLGHGIKDVLREHCDGIVEVQIS
jgi:uncharacterized LabA/DUF88 family protein